MVFPIIFVVIGVVFIGGLIALGIKGYKRFKRRIEKRGKDKSVAIFGNETYRKYIITNNDDPEVA